MLFLTHLSRKQDGRIDSIGDDLIGERSHPWDGLEELDGSGSEKGAVKICHAVANIHDRTVGSMSPIDGEGGSVRSQGDVSSRLRQDSSGCDSHLI